MKVLIALLSLLAVVAGEACYSSTKEACALEFSEGLNCTVKYGLAHKYLKDMVVYSNMHITRSFQYILMSAYFGNYQRNREGFGKLYRKLSDSAWDDAIDLVKYVKMRGGKMDFHYDESLDNTDEVVEMSELESLAKSLDIQKNLALTAHQIYKSAHAHDPEVGSYIAETFLHKHSRTIRDHAGYINDLAKLIKGQRSSTVGMEVFVFDSYLEKYV